MPKKQANAPKPITARLALLKELAERYGVRDNSGLSAMSVMAFVKSVNGFAHTSNDVRSASKQLTVIVHKSIGSDVDKYLTGLRPKQMEEYKEAFGGGEGEEENGGDDGNVKVADVDLSHPAGTEGSKPSSRASSRGRGRGRRSTGGEEKDVGGAPGPAPAANPGGSEQFSDEDSY